MKNKVNENIVVPAWAAAGEHLVPHYLVGCLIAAGLVAFAFYRTGALW